MTSRRGMSLGAGARVFSPNVGVNCFAELSPAALRVLEARYLIRDKTGKIVESPQQLFQRVARAVADAERKWARKYGADVREQVVHKWAREFYYLLSSLRFLPNSPTLMSAGRTKGQLSACFVLPLDDDLASIFETLRDAAVVHKTGGGTGFNFGHIRPLGDVVASSGGVAGGPIAFLELFDSATQAVKQGGVRRGANMAILPVSHPDIDKFIVEKISGGLENFNLSVGITDAFVAAVRRDTKFSLVNPRSGAIVRRIRARDLWRAICHAAWKCGDPGVVYLDTIEKQNPTPTLGLLESTNPCGEQPLLPYESCNLGSINLKAYVAGDSLDWHSLERDIATAVRFLDNVIEVNRYPLLAIEQITLMNRKIGLGVMGWADVLLEWGIAYDSSKAVKRGAAIMRRLNSLAIKASEALAVERGPFPMFGKSRFVDLGQKPRRNATVTTVAPTGTISIIAGVSSGIEPVYSFAFVREALDEESWVFVHPAVRNTRVRSREAWQKLLLRGSISGIAGFSKRVQRVFRTASEIQPIWHVRMQAAFQKFTENGVSKTINLPTSATADDVRKIYETAFALGCKGITVYRDGSKPAQVLRSGLTRQLKKREIAKIAMELANSTS